MADRNEARERIIVVRYANGETMQQIGLNYGISRQRIQQIIKRAALNGLVDTDIYSAFGGNKKHSGSIDVRSPMRRRRRAPQDDAGDGAAEEG